MEKLQAVFLVLLGVCLIFIPTQVSAICIPAHCGPGVIRDECDYATERCVDRCCVPLPTDAPAATPADGSGGWTCFPAGTKVLMAEKNQKNIEDVKVGDKIVSQSEEGKKSDSTVTKLDQPVRDHMCQIKFTNGDSLRLTDEHPLFTQDGWKSINPKRTFEEVPDLPVSKLKKGDKVLKSDETSSEVESVVCLPQRIQTYNLILDNGAHTYFANGFLAHNKNPPQRCANGDPPTCDTSVIECLTACQFPNQLVIPLDQCGGSIVKWKCYTSCSCNPSPTPIPPTPTPIPPTATPIPDTPVLSCSVIGTTIRWSWSGAVALLQVSGSPWLWNDWSSSPRDTSGGTLGNTYTGSATFTGGIPWSNPVSCTIPIVTPTPTEIPSPTPSPTPTTAPSAWIKLKNTSFISANSLSSNIPVSPLAYDGTGDDDGSANFIVGTGGVVGAPAINITGLNASAKTSSPNEYKVTGYSPSFLMTPSSFLSYIKARKQHTVITNPDLSEIPQSGIYIYQGAVALDIDSSNSSVFNGKNVVLISQGTVTISDDFNPTGSVAIVADRINFGNTVAQVRGIFIANTIDSGTAGFGLKVIGNLIAQTTLIKNRTQANPRQPAIFVVYDPVKYNNFYVDLLPYLSTANYDWRQIQ